MKKVFFLSLPILFLSACGNNVNKYKTQIEALASKWDERTTAVTDFSVAIKMEQAELLNLTTNLKIDPSVAQSWPEEKSITYSNIKATTQNFSNTLATMSADVDQFISTWVDKGKQVKGLQEGLKNGSLTGNVEAEITALSNTADESQVQLVAWQEQLAELKSAIQNAKNSFAELQN